MLADQYKGVRLRYPRKGQQPPLLSNMPSSHIRSHFTPADHYITPGRGLKSSGVLMSRMLQVAVLPFLFCMSAASADERDK
jgi:hypothetical protein